MRWLVMLLLLCQLAYAGSSPPGLSTGKVDAEQAIEEVGASDDPFGRSTPSGTLSGLLSALSTPDPTDIDPFVQGEITDQTESQLKQLFDRAVVLRPETELSKLASGRVNDQLAPGTDKVGVIQLPDGNSRPLLMLQAEVGGQKIWRLDPEVLIDLPDLLVLTQPTLLSQVISERVLDYQVLGFPVTHMAAALVLALLTLLLGYVVGSLLIGLVKKLRPKLTQREIEFGRSEVLPVSLLISAELYRHVLTFTGVSVIVREPSQNLSNIVAWIAIAWLGFRVVDLISSRATRHAMRLDHLANLSAIQLLKRVAKAVILIIAVMVVLGGFGFDLTTGIAALGIGGLALALGAQKTVENFVGSVVVVADRPINVGDYCRFGTTEGTVEDIGIRSTRIRTLERTLVTIPNGDFSSMEIENYSKRDRFLFNHTFAFALNTPATQLETALTAIRELLDQQPFLYRSENRVRLRFAERDCFKIEVWAYVVALDLPVFLGHQEDLLLQIIRLLEAQPINLNLPTQRFVSERAEIDE